MPTQSAGLYLPMQSGFCLASAFQLAGYPFPIAAPEVSMRVLFELVKGGHRLHQAIYEIDDNVTFGSACADAWVKVREQCAAKATSIGALMDSMHDSVIDELDGTEIRLRKL